MTKISASITLGIFYLITRNVLAPKFKLKIDTFIAASSMVICVGVSSTATIADATGGVSVSSAATISSIPSIRDLKCRKKRN